MKTKIQFTTKATIAAYRIDGLRATSLTAWICYRDNSGLHIGKYKIDAGDVFGLGIAQLQQKQVKIDYHLNTSVNVEIDAIRGLE